MNESPPQPADPQPSVPAVGMPRTAAFMTLIDDSEIDLGMVESHMGQLETELAEALSRVSDLENCNEVLRHERANLIGSEQNFTEALKRQGEQLAVRVAQLEGENERLVHQLGKPRVSDSTEINELRAKLNAWDERYVSEIERAAEVEISLRRELKVVKQSFDFRKAGDAVLISGLRKERDESIELIALHIIDNKNLRAERDNYHRKACEIADERDTLRAACKEQSEIINGVQALVPMNVPFDLVVHKLAVHLSERDADCKAKDETLREAARKFEEYTAIHWAKKTEEGHEKAMHNHCMAQMCRLALSPESFGTTGNTDSEEKV